MQLNCSWFKNVQDLVGSGPLVPSASTWPGFAGARVWLVCALNPGSSLELPFPTWPRSLALHSGTSPEAVSLAGAQTPSWCG